MSVILLTESSVVGATAFPVTAKCGNGGKKDLLDEIAGVRGVRNNESESLIVASDVQSEIASRIATPTTHVVFVIAPYTSRRVLCFVQCRHRGNL